MPVLGCMGLGVLTGAITMITAKLVKSAFDRRRGQRDDEDAPEGGEGRVDGDGDDVEMVDTKEP